MRNASELGFSFTRAVVRHDPTTPSDVAAFESRHGVRLPADYVLFVSTVNGGIPSFNLLETPHVVCELEAFYYLLALPDDDYYSVWSQSERVSRRLGRPVVAIAGDGSGDQLVLDPSVDSQVKWWRHDEETLGPVASSFEALIDGLLRPPALDEPTA